MRGWLFGLLILLYSSYSTANKATVVTIDYADAGEIADVLEGLVDAGGSVRVYQNQLIINSSPANIAELKDIIELLDEPPRKLLISVKSVGQHSGNSSGFEVSGQFGNGSHHREFNADGTVTETTVKLRSYSRGVSGTSGADQSIQALEGRDAYVLVGQSTLLPSGHYGGVTQISAQQGFWVNARVQGQQVTVSLNARHDSLDGRQLNTASVDTRVQGNLGQWLAIGSLSGFEEQSGSAIASRARDSRSSASTVYIKVQLLE